MATLRSFSPLADRFVPLQAVADRLVFRILNFQWTSTRHRECVLVSGWVSCSEFVRILFVSLAPESYPEKWLFFLDNFRLYIVISFEYCDRVATILYSSINKIILNRDLFLISFPVQQLISYVFTTSYVMWIHFCVVCNCSGIQWIRVFRDFCDTVYVYLPDLLLNGYLGKWLFCL